MNAEPSLSDIQQFMTRAVPYWQTLGFTLKEVRPGKAMFEGAVHAGLMQNQMLHGGVLASIVDSACAVAAISLVFPVHYAVTINLQVSYLRPVLEGRFRAEGKCIKAGKKVLFCEAAVYDNRDELVCTAVSQLLAVAQKP